MFSTLKTREREQARQLRQVQGLSLREIEMRLGVSRSSVSAWVRDIMLTPEQHETLRQRNPAYNGQRKGQEIRAARCRDTRRLYQDEGRALARAGEPFHAAGCMLYWAEGLKNRNCARLSNSDPDVLRFFLAFLRTYFGVPDDRVHLWCNLFADHLPRQREVDSSGSTRSSCRENAWASRR